MTRGVSWRRDLRTHNFDPFSPTTCCTRTRDASEAHRGVARTHPTQTWSSPRSKSTPRSRPNRRSTLLLTFRAEDRSTATRQRSVRATGIAGAGDRDNG
eukprot:2390903-Prymnesium_polylepis.1